jgi:hypothetical protein
MPSIEPSIDSRQSDRRLHLRFEGGTADQHYVAASQLAATIDALRRTVELTALETQGIELRERDRLPAELQSQFGLYVAAPTRGSLIIDAVLGGPPMLLGADEALDDLARRFKAGWQALAGGDWPALSRLFPDRTRLHRWIDAAKRVAPRASGDLRLLLDIADTCLDLTRIAQQVAEFHASQASRRRQSRINGYLAKIDFLKRSFKLRLPEHQRLISGSYTPEAEEFLLANPRELIQVTGLIVYDASGAASEISDATDFDLVDTTPILIQSIDLPQGRLQAHQAIEIPVTLDETEQELEVLFEPLRMILGAQVRDELELMVREEIDLLWRNIASAPDADLTSRAKVIKYWLKQHWTEEQHAAR